MWHSTGNEEIIHESFCEEWVIFYALISMWSQRQQV